MVHLRTEYALGTLISAYGAGAPHLDFGVSAYVVIMDRPKGLEHATCVRMDKEDAVKSCGLQHGHCVRSPP